jgi:hypothetical protein
MLQWEYGRRSARQWYLLHQRLVLREVLLLSCHQVLLFLLPSLKRILLLRS